MKGLLLNQYYSVSGTFRNYLLFSIVIAGILLITRNEMMQSFAQLLPTIFLTTPALEVLKQESNSGWNKFVLTLPIKRKNVVQSHFLFFILAMLSGVLTTVVLHIVADFAVGGVLTSDNIFGIMNGAGVALILGILAYPLTYYFGAEKSDTILIISVMIAVVLFLLSNWLYIQFIEEAFSGITHVMVFTLGFCTLTLVVFLIAYIITLKVYKKKEF